VIGNILRFARNEEDAVFLSSEHEVFQVHTFRKYALKKCACELLKFRLRVHLHLFRALFRSLYKGSGITNIQRKWFEDHFSKDLLNLLM
ncbi:MAG: hypothetical protein ACOYLG_09035, partial [Chitinophagaceae bacterium]